MSSAGGDYKSQVLQATDIVQLIGRSVALKKKGKDWWACCPFHNEDSPSFKVDPVKGFFYCFGCKAKGTVFDFVMKRDRVEFKDALRTLAEAAGIDIPKFGVTKEKAGERKQLLDAHSAACMFYEKLLADPQQGAAARDYLKQRGINEQTVKKFRIGLAPDAWDGLLKSPIARKFAPDLLHRAGLAKKREKGDGYYDTFRHRLMFPIRDAEGRVIGFGGRVMPGSQDPAKYLNSPETPLFSKSRCVFGLDLARQKILETRTAVVVEGYTDVIVAHQFGAENVVSVLGTAMTEQHVSTLRRFADRIVLLFDADAAGDRAVDRTVGLFLTQPVEIAIASMPPETDPDEFLLKEGPEEFNRLVSAAPDALAYKWKQLVRQYDDSGGDLTGQQKAVEQYLEVLAAGRGSGPVDPVRWGMALARVSRLTGVPVEHLNRRFGPTRRPAPRPAPPTESQTVPGTAPEPGPASPPRPLMARDRAERWILGILLLEPQRWHKVQLSVAVDDFKDPTCRRVAELYWDHQRNEGEPVFNEFLGKLEHPALVELAVTSVQEVEGLSAENLGQTLSNAVQFLERARDEAEGQKLLAEFRRTSEQGHSPSEQDEVQLLKRLQEKARRRSPWRE